MSKSIVRAFVATMLWSWGVWTGGAFGQALLTGIPLGDTPAPVFSAQTPGLEGRSSSDPLWTDALWQADQQGVRRFFPQDGFLREDVPSVSQVIHYELPGNPTSYVHRTGRTGRAERSGATLLILSPKEEHEYLAMVRRLRIQTKRLTLPALAVLPPPAHEPESNGQSRHDGRGRDARPRRAGERQNSMPQDVRGGQGRRGWRADRPAAPRRGNS